jgi:Ran GTPase-activating protein (RanGAP) involved in mRNA processing and transport
LFLYYTSAVLNGVVVSVKVNFSHRLRRAIKMKDHQNRNSKEGTRVLAKSYSPLHRDAKDATLHIEMESPVDSPTDSSVSNPSSSQPPLLSDTAVEVKQVLNQLELRAEPDILASGDPLLLETLFEPSIYGRLVRMIVRDDIVLKTLLFPFLSEEGIRLAAATSLASGLSRIPQYIKNRVWLKTSALLSEAESNLRSAYGMTGFLNGVSKFSMVWKILLYSFLINDLYYYYASPETRYDNTLEKIFLSQSQNKASLTGALSSDLVWPELLGVPLLLGTAFAIKGALGAKAMNDVQLKQVLAALQNYRPSWWKDSLYPLNPFAKQTRVLNKAEQALLWDGHLNSQQRLDLFHELLEVMNRATALTKVKVIGIFANLAYGLSDFPRLQRKGWSQDDLSTLLTIKARALRELENLTTYPESESCYKRCFEAIRIICADYNLWSLGYSQTYVLQPLFWAFQALHWYGRAALLWTLGQGLRTAFENYLNKRACLADDKLWMYMDRIDAYVCTVCGDLPIFYNDIFDINTCLSAYFGQSHTVAQLIQAIESHYLKPLRNFSLSAQQLTPPELSQVLRALMPRVTYLQEVSLSNVLNNNLWNSSFANMTDFKVLTDLIANIPIQSLDLSYNQIGDAAVAALAQGLAGSQIQYLDLSYNQIGEAGAAALAQGLAGSQVKDLDLFGNVVQDAGAGALAQGLASSQIQTLDLSSNDIGNSGATALAQGLAGSQVTDLELYSNYVGDAGATALAQALVGSQVQTLDLSANQIGDAGVTALAQVLARSQVQWLGLSGSQINDTGVAALVQGLAGSQVQTLELDNNKIGEVEAATLAQGLAGSQVTDLELYGNQIGDAGAAALAQGLASSKVEVLLLIHNQIGDVGAAALAQGLAGSQVQSLVLQANNIGDAGAAALAQGLTSSKVFYLLLTQNQIGDAGAAALAQGLAGSQVQILDLSYNQIGDAGAKALAQGLRGSQVQYLDLSYNQIGDVGATALAQGLAGSQVQTLELNNNQIGDAGAAVLAQCLANSQVQTLGLSNTSIGDAGAEAIAQQLITAPFDPNQLWIHSLNPDEKRVLALAVPNTKLVSLDLSYNNISDDGAAAMCQVLPQTDVPINQLDLAGNNIQNIDISTCQETSSASTLSPLLPYRVVLQAYNYAAQQLAGAYRQLTQFLEQETVTSHTAWDDLLLDKTNEENEFEIQPVSISPSPNLYDYPRPEFLAPISVTALPAAHRSHQDSPLSSATLLAGLAIPGVNGIIATYLVYRMMKPTVSQAASSISSFLSRQTRYLLSRQPSTKEAILSPAVVEVPTHTSHRPSI